jgi:hypothetical protein
MGATDSKLAFRKGVFRLFEERVRKFYFFIFATFILNFQNFIRMFPKLQTIIGLW